MDICHCQDLVITSLERCRDCAIIDTKVRDMNMYNIRRFTTKCFEFCWKRTIFTSKDDDTQVPLKLRFLEIVTSQQDNNQVPCVGATSSIYIHEVLVRFIMNWSVSS